MNSPFSAKGGRETFATRFGLLMSMIGVAVGLGNVWRFPYMVGQYGGAPFVFFYILMAVFIGVPALMAEWTLGRMTRRGPVGAFEMAGLPFGRAVGRFFFVIVIAATGYYTNALGWVLFHAVGSLSAGLGLDLDASIILPPEEGFNAQSFLLQMASTGLVILACVGILTKGLKRGIERISKVIMPTLLVFLIILIVRGVTLPGAGAGIDWYLFKFEFSALTGSVMMAALGQAVFSLSLGGTYMVIYGSYLGAEVDLRRSAAWTAAGDVTAGLLAGLAIFPAVFALGLEPAGGPGLLFSTLPRVFAEIPAGWVFGTLFFTGLLGAAWLSDVAAFEALVAGLTDNTRFGRTSAVWLVAGLVFLAALPPMTNMGVFIPWDLTFGSGMQTLGALIAVLTVGWALNRSDVLRELGQGSESPPPIWLYYWLRYVIPGAILMVGIWWLLTEVFQVVG